MFGQDTEADDSVQIAQAATPPLRVLALTGPNGSGCTTVSEFFDVPGHPRTQPNELLRILIDNGIVLPGSPLQVDWETLNSEVAAFGEHHGHSNAPPEFLGPLLDAFKEALT